MSEPDVEFVPIVVPDDVEAPDAADFRTMVDIRNRVLLSVRGEDASAVTPAQTLGAWREQTDEEIHGWLLRVDGEPVGRALMYVPLEEGSARAEMRPEVLPEHRRRGIGRAALTFLEDRARERGRTILQAWSEHVPEAGDGIVARSGAGELPAVHDVRFAVSAGYVLEQVYRISALDLTAPLDRLEPLRAGARAAAADYRFVWWADAAPEEFVDDYAWLKSRMSTDAPAADAVIDEETWDAARIRRVEAQRREMGMSWLVGAAQHVESGRLCAFTELASFRAANGLLDQNDTLVLAEHRGHRLGALVKCELLSVARTTFPESIRVVTGNAEENRPMLAINEAMGFVPVRYSGEWQKRL